MSYKAQNIFPFLKFLAVLCLLALPLEEALATHNRAGEITYRYLGSNNGTYRYEFTITTYTKFEGPAVDADRCTLTIKYSDGTEREVRRFNGPNIGDCNGGVLVNNLGQPTSAGRLKINQYRDVHEFPSTGWFTISVEDPNRNADIQNIPNSVNTPFYVESKILINPFLSVNNSPVMTNPPLYNGCTQEPFFYSPAAYDPDNKDSLFYSIVPCRSSGGQSIDGYKFPNQVPFSSTGITLEIDPNNGLVSWLEPQEPGEYNLCVKIEEYRKVGGRVVKIGEITRDMQIDIGVCANDTSINEIPIIEARQEVCLEAGQTVREIIKASDPNNDRLTITGFGENFDNNTATLSPTVVLNNDYFTQLEWPTNCNDIRLKPYTHTIQVQDDFPNGTLTNYANIDVKVIGPAVILNSVLPEANSFRISWSANICPNVTGYKIYRSTDSAGFTIDSCIVGLPAGSNYELVENTNAQTTSFIDNDENLVIGVRYCYVIVSEFGDVDGYVSNEYCAELKKDVPIITRVSINQTDTLNGNDSIEWAAPSELDPLRFSGPYQYRVFRGAGATSNPQTLVYTSPTNPVLYSIDSTFVDTGINTSDIEYRYRVELWSDTSFAGSSSRANSIYLSSTPSDNQLTLTWTDNTPWNNEYWLIYKLDTITQQFNLLDTSLQRQYIDTGLINGTEYCYFVKSKGKYSSDGLIDPILNNSQVHCNIPRDFTPPCTPFAPAAFVDCDALNNSFSWQPTATNCPQDDDVEKYTVFFAPRLGLPLEEIAQINLNEPLEIFRERDPNSVAGCYAVSATDSSGNESPRSAAICLDNCPEYRLPNVFSPGTDNFNDLFKPFPYRFIKRIDLHVYNRWGVEVFTTDDPDILWDGRDKTSSRQLTTGVYYYVCEVIENRLEGESIKQLKGTITIASPDASQVE